MLLDKPTRWLLLLLFLSLFFGCENLPSKKISYTHILDRSHYPTYRAKIPSEWQRLEPAEVLSDTTKPLCELLIKEGLQVIRLTIHNFPTDALSERIPPVAQITRWKNQFEKLDPISIATVNESFGGFAGLQFEASGMLNGSATSIIGFSMQIAPEHYRRLQPFQPSDNPEHLRQKRADYTIKAVGPSDLIAKHKAAILSFARSFELIEEVPSD